jgi:hypothetical protein
VLPVAYVEGPVDYSDLRTQVIGLIYEGLLDYRLKRTDEALGPMVFLNIGRQPVLPLRRLEDMLSRDRSGLKNLLTTLRKEQVTAKASDEEEGSDESTEEAEQSQEPEEAIEEDVAGDSSDSLALEALHTGEYLAAEEAARRWATDAAVLAGLVGRQRARETDAEYQARLDAEAAKLIKRVTVLGDFYLVRAGNTRKGSGTFYTRPELAVPIVHRTLEPLCYVRAEDSTLVPRPPEVILGLKVCDPACGSASFLVAGLDYLTDALYRALCHHRRLDDPQIAGSLTLPLGMPRTGRIDEEIVKFPPNDPYHGDNFEAWVKARLRRHVVERCIYGVDINPLAVELARVSLWIATLDPGLPFSFLDHKIKVGNALVGCWLDRVEDYPLKAWEREGGDGKDGPRSQRIETLLKGEKAGNRRPGDGRIKQEMRRLIENRFQGYTSFLEEPDQRPIEVVAALRAEYQALHEQPIHDPALQEARYRTIEASPQRQGLKRAMDEWCAVWFWPTDEPSLQHVPTPATFHATFSEPRSAIIRRLDSELRFFHWELEFPDVFTTERSGFDALTGNPPWDVMKPNSHEFFSDFDPLYRTYDKQAALRRQRELFAGVPGLPEQWDEYNGRFKALSNWTGKIAEPFDMGLARGKDGSALAAAWARRRQQRTGFADPEHPFRLQGSADLNSYKMFAELFWSLLIPQGRLGVIVPTGIYSDFGTRDLRETLLSRGRIDFLYAFQNEKRVFVAAHHAYKQVALFVGKSGRTESFRTRFRMGVGDSPEAHEIPDDLIDANALGLVITPHDIRLLSPLTGTLLEVRTPGDIKIIEQIYSNSVPLFAESPVGLGIDYSREYHMGDDAHVFIKRSSILVQGYAENGFGIYVNSHGSSAFPLFQGKMVAQFDPSAAKFISGGGSVSRWEQVPKDSKAFCPQYFVLADDLNPRKVKQGIKLGIKNVSNATNQRTLIADIIKDFPTGDTVYTARVATGAVPETAAALCFLNSFVFDHCLRRRMGGLHVSEFFLSETPFPKHMPVSHLIRLAVTGASLSLIHRRFAPEWLELKQLYHKLGNREWKHWWAVTEADRLRLRLRVEIDALCAGLYGLDPDDFDWIVRDDPSDPKGFYRVDRQLPFQERLTGLAAAAFRALKEGKWSAETAASLTNDAFFDLLGIPELTSAQAAHAKGFSGPLIEKRDGCHVWRPESFPPEDPRHGWTWNDCWNDAVALLGSEEAVRTHLEGSPATPDNVTGTGDRPVETFRLKTGSDRPRQKGLF